MADSAPRRPSSRREILVWGGICAAASLIAVPISASSRADDGNNAPVMRYTYGPDASQFVELAVPGGSAMLPVVVIVHGGFWRTGFGVELGRPLAADLVNRGFAAATVEYRRVGAGNGGGGGWPQTGRDVADAVDALGTEGQRLAPNRLDLQRVVGLGHSAGGQLVAWLAARRAAAVRLRGVVSQAGVLDLVRAAESGIGGGAVEDFMGGSPSQKPAAYADASPIARLPLGVPSICLHGRTDTVVPIEQSQRFVAAAGATDSSRLWTFDGDHFDPIAVGTAGWSLSVDAVMSLAGE